MVCGWNQILQICGYRMIRGEALFVLYQIYSDCCLFEYSVPQLTVKASVYAAQSLYEVVFEGLYRSLHIVCSMIDWGHLLIRGVHVSRCHL